MTAARAAYALSRNLPLTFVAASRATYVRTDQGTGEYWAFEWTFVYSSGSGGDAVAVSVAADNSEPFEKTIEDWRHGASRNPIANWQVDSDLAMDIANERGGVLRDSGILTLRMVATGQDLVPIWVVPYQFNGETKCVRGDTGRLATPTKDPNIFTEEPPDEHPGLGVAELGEDSSFDAFISYRRQDQPWVENILLPKLRSWNATYAIDIAHFRREVHFETEMSRLIRRSRWTVVVLTKHWHESPFTEFEADVAAGRLIVIRVDDCELPSLPGGSEVIDLKNFDPEGEWGRLRKILGTTLEELLPEAISPSVTLDATVSFWRADLPEAEQTTRRYQYKGLVTLENPTTSECAFDGLMLLIVRASEPPSSMKSGDTIRVAIDGNRMTVVAETGSPLSRHASTIRRASRSRQYNRPASFVRSLVLRIRDTLLAHHRADGASLRHLAHGNMGRPDAYGERDRAEHRTPLTLAPNKCVRLPNILFGDMAASVAGQRVLELCVTPTFRGAPCAQAGYCAVPPLTRVPMDRPFSFPSRLLAELPAPSGITESALRGQLLHSARNYARDSLLHSMTPRRLELFANANSHSSCVAYDWMCTFSSESRNCTFEIGVNDPGWIDNREVKAGHLRSDTWLTEHHLERCRVDSRLAFLIATQSGAVCVPSHPQFSLVVRKLGDRWRCLWILPLTLTTRQEAAVTADSGELCVLEPGGWDFVSESLWNQFSAPKGQPCND